jgi:hypothetical protein
MGNETVTDANETINDGAENSSISDSLLSSPDYVPPAEESGNEEDQGEDGKSAGAEDKGAGEEGQKAGEAGDTGKTDDTASSGQDTRYDKDPAWQRILSERDAARAEVAALKSGQGKEPAASKPTELPYKDITKMSDEELREWQEDDPKGYALNLFNQVKFESQQSIEQEAAQKSEQAKMVETFTQYASNNPDFDKMWESGQIEAYMKANPGHNAISAHMMLTAGNRNQDIDKKIADAVAKAVAETTEKVTKNFQAKRNATVLNEGPAHRGGGGDETPPELKDTKNFGGRNAVMARRLDAMRNSVH